MVMGKKKCWAFSLVRVGKGFFLLSMLRLESGGAPVKQLWGLLRRNIYPNFFSPEPVAREVSQSVSCVPIGPGIRGTRSTQ